MPCVPRAKINQIKEGFKEAILSFQKIRLEPGVDVVMLDNHADKNQRSYRVLFMQEAVAFQWSITTKWHFYVCGEYMWVCQEGPLDELVCMLSSILCIAIYGMIKIFGTCTNLCDQQLTHIINLMHKFVAFQYYYYNTSDSMNKICCELFRSVKEQHKQLLIYSNAMYFYCSTFILMLDGSVQICMCTVHLFTGIIAICYNVIDRIHDQVCHVYNILIHLIALAIIGRNTVINSIILLARSLSVIEVQLSSTVNGKTYTIMLANSKLNLYYRC